MNTKSNNLKIQPGYEDLFSFEDKESEIRHRAEMISFKILSEVEKLCEEKNIRKKDLADMVGTSKSYITQLFNGSKQINTHTMAKLEDALNMSFDFKLMLDGECQYDLIAKEMTKDQVLKYRWHNAGMTCYLFADEQGKGNKTHQLVSQMKGKENNILNIAS